VGSAVGTARGRVAVPAVILAGALTEVLVLGSDGAWIAAIAVGAATLIAGGVARNAAAVVAIAALLAFPASWSMRTLDHATSGTFPAGGPATTMTMGGGGPGGGGPFAGDTSTLAQAVAYAEATGGGTIAVSSQSGAAGQLITSGADVVAIGGFSGRESEVTLAWLAEAVEDGRIRYVLTEGADGLGGDGRTGSSEVMAAVEALGTPVDDVPGLYDLSGVNLATAGLSDGSEP
jgi:hypothetical protein